MGCVVTAHDGFWGQSWMLIKVKHRGGSACQGPASIPRQSLQSRDGKSTVLKSIMCHLRTENWWRGEAVPESNHVTDLGFQRRWHSFTRNAKLMVHVCRGRMSVPPTLFQERQEPKNIQIECIHANFLWRDFMFWISPNNIKHEKRQILNGFLNRLVKTILKVWRY